MTLLDRITLDTATKLRTYNKFKLTINFEPHLDTISSENLRKLLSKFRVSSHDLKIETGRCAGSKLMPPEQRTCKTVPLSDDMSQIYYLGQSLRVYAFFLDPNVRMPFQGTNLRNRLFNDVNNVNPNFSTSMDPADKFV